jgi:hypothetical protein
MSDLVWNFTDRPTVTPVNENITLIEKPRRHPSDPEVGRLVSDLFPSDIRIQKQSQFAMYTLKADWTLPNNLNHSHFTTLSDLLRAVRSHLANDKIDRDPKPFVEPEAVVPQERLNWKVRGPEDEASSLIFDNVAYTETYGADGTLKAEFTAPYTSQPIYAVRPRGDRFIRLVNVEALPTKAQEELTESSFTDCKRIASAIQRAGIHFYNASKS